MAPPTHAEYMVKFSGMYSGGCSKPEIYPPVETQVITRIMIVSL